MSLLDEIAGAIGHTPETLAQAAGTSVGMLESVLSGLTESGIDAFSTASRLGLTLEGLLRGIVARMNGDPHQQLLNYLVSPVKSMSDPLASLTSHWLHIADLHQSTARALDQHIQDLFQGSGTESYSGPAADTLWNTHQDFQRYFTTLVDHAQTQHTRHSALSGHMDDYVSQMYGKVNGLSTSAAALALLSMDVGGPTTPVIDPKFIQGVETNAENFQNDANSDPPGLEDPVWDFFEALAIALFIFGAICQVIDWAQGIIAGFQGQQKSTHVKSPPKKTQGTSPSEPPVNQQPLTQEQQEALQRLTHDFPDIPQETLKELLEAGFTEQEIRDMIRAGFTNAQFKTLLARIQTAQANGTDQYGVTAAQLRDIATRVAAALNSGDKGRILEGRTALAVWDNIVAFQKKVIDPNTGDEITDIDVETSTAIIQVTTNRSSKLDQTQTTVSNPWVNPENKPVIVFAPNYSRFGIPGLESTGAHYAKTLDDVKRLNQTLHP